MSEAGGASGVRYGWAIAALAAAGIGLWFAQPWLEGGGREPTDPPAAEEVASPTSDSGAPETDAQAEAASEDTAVTPAETEAAASGPDDPEPQVATQPDADVPAPSASDPEAPSAEARAEAREGANDAAPEDAPAAAEAAAEAEPAGEVPAETPATAETPQAAMGGGAGEAGAATATAATEPEATFEGEADRSAETEAAGAAASAGDPGTAAPRFDLVRIDPSGEGLVAGSAAPRATVTVLVDGEPVGEATADGAGSFVAFFSIGVADAARVVTL